MIACSIVLLHFFPPGVQPVENSHVSIDQVQICFQIVAINLTCHINSGRPRTAARNNRRCVLLLSLFSGKTSEECLWYVYHLLRYFTFLQDNRQWEPFELTLSSFDSLLCVWPVLVIIPFVCIPLSLLLINSGNLFLCNFSIFMVLFSSEHREVTDICWYVVMGCNASQKPCY